MAEFLEKWKSGLAKTSKTAFGQIAQLFGATQITTETWEDLETLLIQADIGIETTLEILEELRLVVRDQGLIYTQELSDALRNELQRRLDSAPPAIWDHKPTVGSASASEIVSGCLQDCAALGKCKAIIIGEKTFGKGSVQEIMPLEGGAALRLTTSKYYTPSHKVIHEHGITPDIIVPMTDEEERLAQLKVTPGGAESVEEAERDLVRNARDPQLERALDVLKGIMVFAERSPETSDKSRSGKIAARRDTR